MNQENTRKLLERFRFFHPERPVTEGLMCFGFECGDGWFQVIWDLCERIDNILRVYQAEAAYARGVPFEVRQVKEKFGGLRFYCNWESDPISSAIAGAEDRSVHTCEICGKPGLRRDDRPWIQTLCDEHNRR